MKSKLRNKKIELLVINLIAIAVMALLLFVLYLNKVTVSNHSTVSRTLSDIQSEIDTAADNENSSEARYDALYSSKAATIAYMVSYTDDFQMTSSYLKDLCGTINVTNIIIADSTGDVLVSAEQPLGDFSSSRFNQLREVFETASDTATATPFTVQYEDKGASRRYYAAKIDEDREVIVEHDPAELTEQLDAINSYPEIFDPIVVGTDGSAFAVSTLDYTFLSYAKDPDLIGMDALANGMSIETLTDGYIGFCRIDGRLYYCGVSLSNDESIFIVAAVPASEIIGSAVISAAVILFVFILVMGLISYYGYRMYRDSLYGIRSEDPGDYRVLSSADSNRLITLSVLGFLIIAIVSAYIQFICDTSDTAIDSMQTATEIHTELRNNEANASAVEEQYNRRYLNKALMASRILSSNHQLWNRQDLMRLNEALDTEALYIFDNEGVLQYSTSSLVHMTLSEDPTSQTYDFRKLLAGLEYLIQEPRENDVGTYSQFIGYILLDDEGVADGFVQIQLDPDELTDAINEASMNSILSRAASGINGLLFATDSETGEITYHNNPEEIGRNIRDLGISPESLYDGFSDYLTISGESYFADCTELNNSFVIVALPNSSNITGDLLQVTLGSSILTLISLLIISCFLCRDKVPAKEAKNVENVGDKTLITPTSARNPIFGFLLSGGENRDFLMAEQAVSHLARWIFTIVVFLACILMIFRNSIFSSDSIILYILNQRWQKEVNIFSVTACLVYVCIAQVIVIVSGLILSRLSKTASPRAQTVYQLLRSLIKYIVWIAIIYYCLSMFGVDTTTLLASAGLLSVAVGLGSQSLISDIIAGLFIIIEGEFRVGDIVNIGGWTGTVTELGVRTTKVESGGNVKVFTNSSVSGVINMSQKSSSASISVNVKDQESLSHVEDVLKKELPAVKEAVSEILTGPSYDGVTGFPEGAFTISISAGCLEDDRGTVEKALYRAVRLIFEQNNIQTY